MSPTDIAAGALTLGTLLVLLAVFAPDLPGMALGDRRRFWARTAAAVAGVVLLGWGLVALHGTRSAAESLPAASIAPSPADLVDAASVALERCTRAMAPALPNGATASQQAMLAARAAFQSYDAATNSYVHCVDTTIQRIAGQYAAVASAGDLKALADFGRVAHDTAIDQEQAIADQFNAQLRIYKARRPPS
jgi:hypothetical protein